MNLHTPEDLDLSNNRIPADQITLGPGLSLKQGSEFYLSAEDEKGAGFTLSLTAWAPPEIPGPLADFTLGHMKWSQIPQATIDARIFYRSRTSLALTDLVSGIPDIVLTRSATLRIALVRNRFRLAIRISQRRFNVVAKRAQLDAIFDIAPSK